MPRLLLLIALFTLPLGGCRDTPGVIPFVDVNVDLNLALQIGRAHV